jgi:diguanylate cyclase (GGDEF)-like protein
MLEQTTHASLWFPAAGLSFAAFLAFGPRAAVAIVVGCIVTTFESAALHADPRGTAALWASGVAFGAVHALAYGLGAGLFSRLYGNARLSTPGSVVGFLLVSTLTTLLAALGGLGSLAATGAAGTGLAANFMPWWIGDLVGVVTLGPAFLVAADGASRGFGLPSSGWWEGFERLGSDAPHGGFYLKLGASVALALALGALGATPELKVPVAFVVYALTIPLMWIAHTEGAFRTVLAVAGLATAVAVATRLFGTTEQAFHYQAAMIALAGTGLFNVAVPTLYSDNRRLRSLVSFDQLTGARSRPVFLEAAELEFQRARRNRTVLAVVAFDIDAFKSINDSLGHAAGDRVLATVGETCRAELRAVDVFGRLGGEEFAVLLPAADLEAARLFAERLRGAFEDVEWGAVVGARRVTASFGVAAVRDADPSFAPALERADRALYEAKRAGRNCVRAA